MKIEILGGGCANCHKLEENTKKALAELNKKAEILKVTDVNKFADYGVMVTPALVIDGKVKCSGRVADVNEIITWIK